MTGQPSFDPGNFHLEDLDRIADEAKGAMDRLAKAENELADVRGRGAGANGLITVVIDSKGLLETLDMNPRVMRLESHVLAEETASAFRAAQEDAQRRTREVLSETVGEKLPHGSVTMADMETRLLGLMTSGAMTKWLDTHT
ncbi:YbaB/EbfC family nucleoid-associated protein [Nonomuraea indica]|uniref:YbaB/EbfC family nucleoid-associated protein n=1 Tax=Nonomuraea indica TaxID=1581193 RepID=A0ABW8AGB6_9ACTN